MRTASFCFAELLLAIGLVSGVDAHDEVFTVHTIQHILIGMVAPIFLALSAPITLALQASNRRVQTGLLKVLHTPVAKVLSPSRSSPGRSTGYRCSPCTSPACTPTP